jgi:hypothetical protein
VRSLGRQGPPLRTHLPPLLPLPLQAGGSEPEAAVVKPAGAISGALATVLSSPATWLLAVTYFFVYLVRQGWAALATSALSLKGPSPQRLAPAQPQQAYQPQACWRQRSARLASPPPRPAERALPP